MQKSLVSSLLKAKNNDTKKIEALIEAFLSANSAVVKARTQSFVSDLMVYIMRNVDIDKAALMSIVQAKLTSLTYEVSASGLDEIYAKTAQTAMPVKFVFDKVDSSALAALHRNFAWIGADTSQSTQTLLKTAVEEAFNGDIPVRQLGEVLRERFGDAADKSAQYYQMAADAMIRRSQSIARLAQYQKYGVTHIQISAIVDDDTSDTCRSLNGKIIPIAHLQAQSEKIVSANSIEDIKSAAPWQSKPILGDLPDGVGLAPFHPYCRTENLPYFGGSTDIEGKNANGSILPGEKFGKKTALFSHVDKTGVERVVTKTYREHSQRTKPTDKDVISGMNSVNRIAVHNTEVGRTLTLSSNMVMIFDGRELLTAIKLEDKKKALAYFKRNSIESKMEVIKWDKERWQSILAGILSFAPER